MNFAHDFSIIQQQIGLLIQKIYHQYIFIIKMLKFFSKTKNNLIYNSLFFFAKFSRDKEHLNVGTIGHIDHGKTTLTSAITKILSKKNYAKYLEYGMIDKAPQQKARGITINTATLQYQTDKRHYGHVDCPGHIDYVKNMITGAAKMDAGILVVAATDGPMPQTKEHILLCRQIGVPAIIVFLNKCDLIKDPEMLEVIQMQLKQILKKHDYDPDKVRFVKGSALHAMNQTQPEMGQKKILELLDVMDNFIPVPVRPIDKPFFMSIEGTYNIQGRGAVATGTIQQGKVKIGDQLQMVGYDSTGKKVTITGIETFNKTLDYGEAGDNVGLLMRGLLRDDIYRGLILAKPKTLTVHSVFQASIYCLKTEQGGRKNPFSSGYRPQLYYKTADSAAQIELPENTKIAMPGDNLTIRAKLNFPLAITQGARFALRQGGRTIAAGVITKILPETTQLDFGKPKKKKQEPVVPAGQTPAGQVAGKTAAKPDAKDKKASDGKKTAEKPSDKKPATGKVEEKKATTTTKPAQKKPQQKKPQQKKSATTGDKKPVTPQKKTATTSTTTDKKVVTPEKKPATGDKKVQQKKPAPKAVDPKATKPTEAKKQAPKASSPAKPAPKADPKKK